MLKHLFVSNYALIDQVKIDFGSGFSVITGETGAGKSIILGALALVLGQRSDASALKNKDKKSIIEAVFCLSGYGLEKRFEEEDVDFDDETIVRREVMPNGKSRAFVNDTPVNLAFLKDISLRLIDVHSQHQNLLLGQSGFQLGVVDTVANNMTEKLAYQKLYSKYNALVAKRNDLEVQNTRLAQEADYMQFQFDELNTINPISGEQESLELELNMLSNAEEIKGSLFAAVQLLSGDQNTTILSLKEISKHLAKVSAYIPESENWINRCDSACIDLEDLASELETKTEATEYDPERLVFVNSRLDAIYALQQKHRVDSVESLIKIKEELNCKLQKITSFADDIENINKDITIVIEQLKQAAAILSSTRKKVIPAIENKIVGQLIDLGMPNAQLCVECKSLENFTEYGTDDINFLFSANKKGELSAIPKVASGGEMSRVMLCIKSLLSSSKGLPTIIFDEIDTGVSGEVADKMGRIMQEMALNIQVISITHLPQIAAKGKHHFKVYKKDSPTDTFTNIEELNQEARITELAKMLSGSNITDAALSNAKELLGSN